MTLSMAIADMEREDMITKIAFKENINIISTRFYRRKRRVFCSLFHKPEWGTEGDKAGESFPSAISDKQPPPGISFMI